MVVKLPGSVQQAMVQQRQSRRTTPLWEGPGSSGINGGITQGLLCKWLVCRERTRILLVEGLISVDDFSHRIEYGSMWHVCEEALARGPDPTNKKIVPWKAPLEEYTKKLCKKYPLQQDQVIHWYEVCKIQFPHYVEFWSKHPDVVERKPLLQEEEFRVPYTTLSGRSVYLRGKWDSVDLVGKRNPSIVLKENKSKGDINEPQLKRQLTRDLQSLFYLVALGQCKYHGWWSGLLSAGRISGINYNVIRRPLSGGKGTIVRHKGTKNKPEETKEAFYKRLGEVIAESPENFFMRWQVGVSEEDITDFKNKTLDPILEHLCWWWDVVSTGETVQPDHATFRSMMHWTQPFGVYSSLLDGGETPYDTYIQTGSTIGLAQTDVLFPELEN